MAVAFKTSTYVPVQNVMSRELVLVSQHMLVRDAARLLHQSQATAAPVVDEQRRCVGVFSGRDVFRWVEAGCPAAVVGPALSCPYQVRGRLVTGGEGVICVLAHGSCPFQVAQPSTGGRYPEICTRHESDASHFQKMATYMTNAFLTVVPQTSLSEVVEQVVSRDVEHVVVLDELERPIGIVTMSGLLRHVHNEGH